MAYEIMSNINSTIMMSSKDISELTGKRHADVMRDVRVMIEQMEQSEHNANLRFVCKSTTYIAETGQSYPMYELDKNATICLVAGYDAVVRMAIINRWQELEDVAKKPLTPAQMLLGMAQQLVEHEAQLEQHDDRIKLLESENVALKEELKLIRDEEEYFTAKGAAQLHGIKNLTETESRDLGKELSKLSRLMGVEIKQTPHKGYGYVNLYHRDVVNRFFSDIDEE